VNSGDPVVRDEAYLLAGAFKNVVKSGNVTTRGSTYYRGLNRNLTTTWLFNFLIAYKSLVHVVHGGLSQWKD
jgi:hypothetical protein